MFELIAIQVGIAAFNKWVAPKLAKWIVGGKAGAKPRPDAIDFPLTVVGTPVPLIYGTVRVNNPIIYWRSSGTAVPRAFGEFNYRCALLIGFGVRFSDRLFGVGGADTTMLSFSWGGPGFTANWGIGNLHTRVIGSDADAQDRGGVYANVQFHSGNLEQEIIGLSPPTLIETACIRDGTPTNLVPGYRGQILLTVIADDINYTLGTSARIPEISARIRCQGGLNLIGSFDANPAWVIYDLICGDVFKMGYPESKVDRASFEAAAVTLVTEQNGCSVLAYSDMDMEDVIAPILAQINGFLVHDPTTDLLKLKLFRFDYNAGTIPVVTVDNTIGRPKIEVTTTRDAPSQCRVTYTNRANGKHIPDVAIAQRATVDLGRFKSLDVEYPWCTDQNLAGKLATRDLAFASRSIIGVQAVLNREFYGLLPGDVVKVQWPAYGVTDKVFRVLDIDDGQLADGGIRVTMVEDVFDVDDGAIDDPTVPIPVEDLIPITERYVDECPRYLAYQLMTIGGATNATTPRTIVAHRPELDNHTATRTELRSTFGDTGDVPLSAIMLSAKVAVAYDRVKDPIDDATGLVIEGPLSDGIVDLLTMSTSTPATPAETANGKNLMVVGGVLTGDGLGVESYSPVGGEYMTFESVTDLGGGQWRLNNIRRGLLDTVPADHAVGASVHFIGHWNVGRISRTEGSGAAMYHIPVGREGEGTDGASFDVIKMGGGTVAAFTGGRASREYPVANMGVKGLACTGTAGNPDDGYKKTLTLLDESIDVRGWRRSMILGQTGISAGDNFTQETPAQGTTYGLRAKKAGESEVTIATGATTPQWDNQLIGKAGYGDIDVRISTDYASYREWQTPYVRCTAPMWRNLLINPRGDLGTAGWTATAGTIQVGTGTFGLGRATTAKWFAALTADGNFDTIFRQTVDVTGYKARGLLALLAFYVRPDGVGEAGVSAVIECLDAASSVLDSATLTPFTAINLGFWRRISLFIAIPANTTQVRVTIQLLAASGIPGARVTEISLRVGELDGGVALGRPSFDNPGESDPFLTWTNVTNSFTAGTAIPYATLDPDGFGNYAQGGAFSTSEIRTEPSFDLTGSYGVAVLTFARATTIAGDTGEVILEARNGGGLLTSVTTGATSSATLDVWTRHRLTLQIPEGATTLRVRLLATRAAGSGNSGACFDDFDMVLHKDLDPVEEIALDFTKPVPQPIVTTWQSFHIAHSTLAIPSVIAGASTLAVSQLPSIAEAESGGDITQIGITWSDGVDRAATKIYGHWGTRDINGQEIVSADAFQFTRASAPSAVDIQVYGGPLPELGAFSVTQSFTAIVRFRANEFGAWAACGLVGRRDSGGIGWGIQIDATGHAQAVLQGVSGTKTATRPSTLVNEGGIHQVVLVYNEAADTLRIYDDRRGFTETSTASGLGEFLPAGSGSSVPLRIGRDAVSSQTMSGQIQSVMIAPVAYTQTQVESMWTYGQDPTGEIETEVRTQMADGFAYAGWKNGTIVPIAKDQIALAYHPATGKTGFPISPAMTNACPSFDFRNSAWQKPAGTTVTYDQIDATGLPRGVQLGLSATNWYKVVSCSVGAVAKIVATFWGKLSTSSVGVDVDIRLLNSDGVLKQSITKTMGNVAAGGIVSSAWTRYDIEFTAWDGSTPTCEVEFRGTSGAVTLELSHVVCVFQPSSAANGQIPTIIPKALGSFNQSTWASASTTPLKQMQPMGEIDVEGVCISSSFAASYSGQVAVASRSNSVNRRELLVASAGVPRFRHYDHVQAQVNSDGTAPDWSQPWRMRGRWNIHGLRDIEPTVRYGGLVVDASVDSAVYGVTSAWAHDVSADYTALRVGDIGHSLACIIERVTFRTRDKRL